MVRTRPPIRRLASFSPSIILLPPVIGEATLDKGDTYVLNIASSAEMSHGMTDIAFFPYRNDIIDHSAQQKFDQVKSGYQLTIPKAIFLEQKIQKIQVTT